jgi:hypothetical protein
MSAFNKWWDEAQDVAVGDIYRAEVQFNRAYNMGIEMAAKIVEQKGDEVLRCDIPRAIRKEIKE